MVVGDLTKTGVLDRADNFGHGRDPPDVGPPFYDKTRRSCTGLTPRMLRSGVTGPAGVDRVRGLWHDRATAPRPRLIGRFTLLNERGESDAAHQDDRSRVRP